jgi:hypothetical protein
MLQSVRHCPSAQTFPWAHSLEYLQVALGSMQKPFEQVRPASHGFTFASQAHGPFVPPHVTHLLLRQTPPLQSAFVVHSMVPPGFVPGATQSFDCGSQTRPFAQSVSAPHFRAHPFWVQTSFD